MAKEVANDGCELQLEEKADTSRRSFYHSVKIALPLCVYSITASMFIPVFQSLVFQKVRESNLMDGDGSIIYLDQKSASTNQSVQAQANWIVLLCSVAMCIVGGVSSTLNGRIGDTKSRKMALVIPFVGLILADCTLILQSFFFYLSAHWLILSEAVFAFFGGYVSIFSSSFAYASDSVECLIPQRRSQVIAVLEGAIGLGGSIGYMCTPIVPLLGFTSTFTVFSFLHVFCVICIFLLPDRRRLTIIDENRNKPKLKFFSKFLDLGSTQQKTHFFILLFSFALSFLSFIGSAHILFFYLKYRFNWDIARFGLLKGPSQGLSTVATMFLYPFLRSYGVTDRSLSLLGLASRACGRLWLAVAWSTPSVFLLIGFDAFSRFAPTGIRAMLANSIFPEYHGSMFALVALVEAVCNLVAAVIFHLLFPFSIPFLPQISYFILFAILAVPIFLIWWKVGDVSEKCSRRDDSVELKAIEKDDILSEQ